MLLLGPVAVVNAAADVHRVTSARQAALLTVLATYAGAVVSRDRLVETLWGERPPATARNTLQVHASALRRVLGSDTLRAEGDGYVLDAAVEVDAERFRRLTAEGQAMVAEEKHAEAARLIGSGLALWRGEPLAGLDVSWAEAERERLRSLHLLATTTRLDADLALGRHLLVLDELEALCSEHPLREDLAERRMLALYRSGRQAEALKVYEQVRQVLVDELGVDPGEALRSIHVRMLQQDESLLPPWTSQTTQLPWRSPLPTTSGSFVGREGLMSEVSGRLAPGRLVTLVGPSGIGKSRLAVELARRAQAGHGSGALFVDASSLDGSADLVTSLGRRLDHGPAALDPAEVERLLRTGDLLIVLDDVSPGGRFARELAGVVSDSSVTWLATATRPVGLPGEHVVGVPPLASCGPDGGVGPGIELFLERAEMAGAQPGRTADELAACARCVDLLDGLPLAIELAAPGAVLGADELEIRLTEAQAEGRYGVAISFATSLDRLDERERQVLDLLALCRVPIDLELVVAAGLPGLDHDSVAGPVAGLVRDGLVRRTSGPHGHVMLDLAGSVASQVTDRSAPDQQEELVTTYVAACVRTFAFSQYLSSQFRSPAQAQRSMALLEAGQRALLLAEKAGMAEEGARLAVALHELQVHDCGVNPHPERFLWPLEHDISWQARTDLHLVIGIGYSYLCVRDRTSLHFDAALVLAEEHDDQGRLAMLWINAMVAHLWDSLPLEDPTATALAALEAAERCGEPDVLACTYAVRTTGPDVRARLEHGLRLARLGGFVGAEALCLANLADLALETGDLAAAERYALEGGALASELHQPYLADAMAATLEAVRAINGSGDSLAALATVLQRAWGLDDLRTATDAVQKLAAGSRHRGEHELARTCVGLYDAMLAHCEAGPATTEVGFAETWLGGCSPTPPRQHIDAAVTRLVEAFHRS